MRALFSAKLAVQALLCAFAIGGFATTAHARAQSAMIVALPLLKADLVSNLCTSAQNTGGNTLGLAGPRAASKSAAILGGEMSALELMKQQQAQGQAASGEAVNAMLTALQPAAAPAGLTAKACANLSKNHVFASEFAPLPRRAGPGEFLASKRVPIGKTHFDREWHRVSGESVPAWMSAGIIGREDSTMQIIAKVNRWVNREIAFTDDRTLFGTGDYWAGARATLRLKAGDCEDIALTKMQLLAAAGIPREDMILTLARDTVRNADHALLIVRVGDEFVALDNTTDKLLDAALAHDYTPVLSFGSTAKWVHGY